MGKASVTWAAVAGLGGVLAGAAQGVEIRVDMPGVNGPDDVPGYVDTFPVLSLKIEPGGLITVVKSIDSASPDLVLGGLQGTHFPNSTILLHNPPATGQPAATITLSDVLVSSYSLLGGETEEVVLNNAGGPGSIYLVLPGIAGEDGVPGYPQAIKVDSFELTSNSVEFVREVDSASPAIMAASLNGTLFPFVPVLLYQGQDGGLSPAAQFQLSDVLISSYQTGGSGGPGDPVLESVSLNFSEVEFLPEPAGFATSWMGLAVAGMCGRSRRRR